MHTDVPNLVLHYYNDLLYMSTVRGWWDKKKWQTYWRKHTISTVLLCVRNFRDTKGKQQKKAPLDGKGWPTILMVKRGRRAMKPSISSTCELAISAESGDDDKWVEIKWS